ncbi:hypothetical protein LguiB_002358 [Lonicera macranthoides]
MILLLHSPLSCSTTTPTKFRIHFKKQPLTLSPFSTNRASFKCCCLKNVNSDESPQGFSVLKSETPCDNGSIWSTMALYMFSLHVPLSFGGLSIVAEILHQPVLDPQTEALSVLVFQTLELIGVSLLLRFSADPQYELLNFFQDSKLPKERNWLLASFLGFGFLLLLVFLTSLLADVLIGPKDVNDPILKQILSNGSVSVTACTLVYCIISPLLEETVYRGFLLKSLASTMEWKKAVFISSAVFSAAHFSGENFLQLFIIGSVLGSSYCWTGKLSSSILIHSLYNALTLLITFAS